MKHIVTSISSLVSVTFVAILAVTFILSSTSITIQAATDNTNTGIAVRCPTGYTCVPTVQTAAVVCPTGYVCTPKNEATTISRPTTTYRPGSYTNLILRPQEQTLTPAQIQALTQSQTVASTIVASSGQQLTPAQTPALTAAQMQALASSTTGTSTYAQQVAAQVNAIIARAPTSWTAADPFVQLASIPKSPDMGGNLFLGYYATDAGAHLKSFCGPNQFLNTLVNPIGCMDNFASSSPIVLNPTVPFDAGSEPVSSLVVTDPYCSVISNVPLSGSGSIVVNGASPTYDRMGDKSPNLNSAMQKQNCVVGEAYKNQPYINPWVTVNNLFGIVKTTYRSNLTDTHPKTGSNYCMNSISLREAKNSNDQQLAVGIHNDLYTNNARLYAPQKVSLFDIERYLTYVYAPLGQNAGMIYWWNGAKSNYVHSEDYITMMKIGDIKDPEFLALFDALQLGSASMTLMRCLDPGYISNLPAVAGHYQSELMMEKKLGLI